MHRSPRVIRATFLLMPVGSTSQRSVQVSGFNDHGHLTPLRRLIRFLFVRPAFCLRLPSDSQSPAWPPQPNWLCLRATRHAWRTMKKMATVATFVAMLQATFYVGCRRRRRCRPPNPCPTKRFAHTLNGAAPEEDRGELLTSESKRGVNQI